MKKIALVTGASRGIGKACAEKLVDDGFFVIGTATSSSGAENISNYLNDNGCGLVLDVCSNESVDSVIKQIKEKFGDINVLVNNAGITKDNLLMRMNDDQWNSIIDTNLNSIFRLSKAVLRPMMKNKYGRIINIGSVVGSSGNPGQSNYCAAKAGLIGFSKALAKEVASRGITVNVVAPGFIATDMTDALNDEQKGVILNQIPAQALGTPKDIAYAVAFLSSENAGYINGETLHVNGGLYMN